MAKWSAEELDGMFTGSLEPEEYQHFIDSGKLYRSYEDFAGLLGLSKLRLVDSAPQTP